MNGNYVGSGATVLGERVIGPYEVVRLRARDSRSLESWLTSHRFVIPQDLAAVVASYVSEGFDFVSIKLVPGADVTAMRPVRVTVAGPMTTLPLRMIAAGAGARVGLTLFVVGEGRYEPRNMPTYVIGDADLVWDWSTRSSNDTAVRATRDEAQRDAWEIECSVDVTPDALRDAVRRWGGQFMSPSAYPIDGGALAMDEDVRALLGPAPRSMRITRMRSALDRAALARDLILSAPVEQSALPRWRSTSVAVGEEPCGGNQAAGQSPEEFCKAGTTAHRRRPR